MEIRIKTNQVCLVVLCLFVGMKPSDGFSARFGLKLPSLSHYQIEVHVVVNQSRNARVIVEELVYGQLPNEGEKS